MTSRIRKRARVVAVVAIAAGAVLSWVPPASAVTVDGAGWWWRTNTTTVPVEVPPRADVGTDQLLVEGEPEGATAVAAVRFKLAEGESSPILTITPTPDSVVPPTAVIQACRVGSAWSPAQGGKWERKPIADCFASVQGIPSDGGAITFALTPLQSGTDLEVVIVPGVDPNAVNDNAKFSAFSLKFTTPTAADLKTTTADAGFSGTGGDFSAPDPGSFGADTDSSSGDSSSFDSGSSFDTGSSSFDSGASFGASPAFTQPADFAAPTAVESPAEAALAPTEQADVTGAAPVAAAPVATTTESNDGRTLGILVLLAGAALGFWAYSGSAAGRGVAAVPVAPPPGAEPVIGGLGRFARPRTGPPPSLS